MFAKPTLTYVAHPSKEDASVNFVVSMPDGGFLEARFVQRDPSYIIVYLSSHTGCQHTCRFCHLTATGQRTMTPATLDDYLSQARVVLEHYRTHLALSQDKPAPRVHFNFMARGEALSNPHFVNHSKTLFARLRDLATHHQFSDVQFKISSILPQEFDGNLATVLDDPSAQLYYSLYSLDPAFRKRWLPKALPAEEALDRIAAYQASPQGKPIALHWAFIQGQNDSPQTIAAIVDAIKARHIQAKFNLVRYNPYDDRYGVESAEPVLQARFAEMLAALGDTESRIVPRVGRDVQASCGCFIEP